MITKVLDLLLRMAVHRWPETLREQANLEWRAELAEIRGEAGAGATRRTLRALSFAASLARSRVGAADETWIDRVGTATSASRPFLLLLTMPFLAYLGSSTIGGLLSLYQIFLPGVRSSSSASPGMIIRDIATLLVTIAVAGWIGWLLGGRLPVVATKDRMLGLASAGLAVPVFLGTGALVTFGLHLTAPEWDAVEHYWPTSLVMAMLVFWALELGAIGWLAGRRLLAGHGRSGTAWAAISGLVAVWIVVTAVVWTAATGLLGSSATAPLWFPVLLVPGARDAFFGLGTPNFPPGTAPLINWLLNNGNLPGILLTCTAFALTYTLRHARQPVAPRIHSTAAKIAADVRMPALSPVAWVLTGGGVLIWADALTLPIRYAEKVEAAAGDSPNTVHLWLQEVRQLAIFLVGLGLVMALRKCKAAPLAATIAAAGLFAADLVIDSRNLEGLTAFLFALASALALVLTALWVSTVVGPAGEVQASGSRRYLRIAVAAAFAAPAGILNTSSAPLTATPADLTADSVGVAVLLAALAGVCAVQARAHPATPRTVVLAAIPAALLTCVPALQLVVPSQVPYLAFLGVPLAAYFIGMARWSRRPEVRTFRVVIGRIGFAVLAVVATPLLLMQAIALADQVSPLLMEAAGYSYGADGVPYALGAIVIGSVFGFLVTIRFRRVSLRRTKPQPAIGTEPA